MLESGTTSPIETRGFALSSRPVIAVDLGGTRIRAAVVQPDGTRLARFEMGTPTDRGPHAIVRGCRDVAKMSREQAPASEEESRHREISDEPWPHVRVSVSALRAAGDTGADTSSR